MADSDSDPGQEAEVEQPEVPAPREAEPGTAALAPQADQPPAEAAPPVSAAPMPAAAFPPTVGLVEPATMPPAAAPKAGLRPFAVLIGIAVAMVLVIGTALFFILGGNDLQAAEDRVLSYYKELSDKDGKAAKKLLKNVDGGVYDYEYGYANELADSPFWKSGALSSGYTAPAGVEVVRSISGTPPGVDKKTKRQYALVTVAYTVDGRPATETFSLERDRKGEWSILTARLGVLNFGESAFQYRIAGFEPEEDEYYGSLILPPGTYKISLEDNEIFEDEKTDLVIAPGLEGSLGADSSLKSLDLKVRDGIAEEVEAQVKEVVDICATGDIHASMDYDCDWETEDGESIPPLSVEEWDVKAYPEIEIVVDEFGNAEVQTVKPGKAEGEDMFDGEKFTAVIEPSGAVYVEDGEVSWGED